MSRIATAVSVAGGMALMAFAAPSVQAQTLRPGEAAGTGLEDFVNSVVGQADAGIAARGWRQAGGNGRVNYWWNAQRQQCAAFVVSGGRYTTIQLTDPVSCNHGGDGGNGEWGGGGWRPPVTPPGNGGWNGGDGWSEYSDFACTGSEGAVTVQMRGREGRIELPASLMPPPSAWGRPGRDGAWWTLNNVYVSNSRATARYNMPGAGTPRLTIDRRSGRITITGSNRYRYTGVCTASMALRPR